MWQLKNISAQNLFTFRELHYRPLQGCTTLVFGNNQDNESQGSNGSGKSALIEAFAISLTGESLREVSNDEAINDACDNAQLSCELINTVTNQTVIIERFFNRNSPQSISLRVNGEPVVLPSVLEYNRHILNLLGLSKADILSCFILSKYTYTSFLNAPDRAKKELINRFSNGNLVDESITHLKEDIERAKEQALDAEKRVARCEGAVQTVNEQIEAAEDKESTQLRRREEMIQAHEEAITHLRSQVRTSKQTIADGDNRLKELDKLNQILEDLEDSSANIDECYNQIILLIKQNSLSAGNMREYPSLSKELGVKVAKQEKAICDLIEEAADIEKNVASVGKQYDDLVENYETVQGQNTPKCNALQQEINEANSKITSLTSDNRQIIQASSELQKEISRLQGVLAGRIECPACHHQFILDSDMSLEQLNSHLLKQHKMLRKNEKTVEANEYSIDHAQQTVEKNRNELSRIDEQINELAAQVRIASAKASGLRNQLDKIQVSISGAKNQVADTREQILSLRKELFDDAFEIVDIEIRNIEGSITTAEVSISTANGSIKSYEDAIVNLNNTSVSDTLDKLKEQKNKYENELLNSRSIADSINIELAELQKQEVRFTEFKTHLANSKIEALGQLTNQFLESIGSDIRIAFSGYTILRSGKIRDKISISLLRDGIDCGSFAKFSAGEQCRVNLASILALHRLTNTNCEAEKGLDLLILDEILDATDEAGLANMFQALNSFQITSMIVSHGQIAEAYPYRLTITKQNGISTINETNT